MSGIIVEPQFLWAIDVSDSTSIKWGEGDLAGNRQVRAAMDFAVAAFRLGDASLKVSSGSEAGDSRLLVEGKDLPGAYRKAVWLQSDFKSWHENRLAIKIVGGYASYEQFEGENGVTHAKGREIDYLFRVLSKCPEAEICVTPAAYSVLKAAGYGERFLRIEEELDGIPGISVWYEESDGFVIPPGKRQRAINPNRRQNDVPAVKPAPIQGDSFTMRVLAVGLTLMLCIVILMSVYRFLFPQGFNGGAP
jgi:hypothetical protein